MFNAAHFQLHTFNYSNRSLLNTNSNVYSYIILTIYGWLLLGPGMNYSLVYIVIYLGIT